MTQPNIQPFSFQERALSHWPTHYPASALTYQAAETEGHETDASADGSQHTNDSGRGPSDIGESSHKTTPQRNNTTPKSNSSNQNPSNQISTQRSVSPALRTFTPSPTLDLATSGGDGETRTDTQFKIVHARPVNVITTPTRTSSRPSSPRKGAVVRIDDFQNSDPKRARAYYKDSPLYSRSRTEGSPHSKHSLNQSSSPGSKVELSTSNGSIKYIKDIPEVKNSTFV